MKSITVDYTKKLGNIKPLHGVGNGPVTSHFTYDTTDYFKEAGFPYARLHDTEYPYGSGEFVDISCVFKNFDLDVNDPKSYNFTFTDAYLKAINNTDAKIIYRLGQSIEHAPIKLYVYPPKDYMKWAQICEHIIRHYNEGWADGYNMGIEYWEIWNEPDLYAKCWFGEWEEYAKFYKVVSRYLKDCFPNIKIGGPAVTSPNNHEFIDLFLSMITEGDRAPLDFFSWHGYTSHPRKARLLAQKADNFLKKYGYDDAVSVYDEWNYVKDWNNIVESYEVISSLKGAAYCAGQMIELQNSPCDIATYYDGQLHFDERYCGIFKRGKPGVHGKAIEAETKKPFYAFKAFNMLYQLGTQIEVGGQEDDLFVLAAGDDESCAVMISNYTDAEIDVSVDIAGLDCSCMNVYVLDDDNNLKAASRFDKIIKLGAYNVCVIAK